MKNKQEKCHNCGKCFIKVQWNQIFCGSKTNKIGCSYKMHIKQISNYNKTKYRKWIKNYNKKWHREQRKLNTLYAKRQRNLKRVYNKSNKGKLVSKCWRKRNISKILDWNRQRLLKKKGVVGSHSNADWLFLKKKFNYRCALCDISENELSELWKGTNFDQLTRDHIIPVSKNGTDFIENIQPLCISCNSKKYNW